MISCADCKNYNRPNSKACKTCMPNGKNYEEIPDCPVNEKLENIKLLRLLNYD